jgi:branched-chain amino acid transport system substrate-binding protein
MNRLTIPTLFLALLSAVAIGCGSGGAEPTTGGGGDGAAAEEGDISIGVIGPLSGLYAAVGEAQKAGIELAVEELEGGAIDGRKVVLHFEDDEVDPQAGVNALLSLTSDEGIVALFGSTVTAVSQAMSPQLEKMQPQIPQVGVLGTGTVLQDWMFAVLSDDDGQIAKLTEYVEAEGLGDKLGIIADNTDLGKNGTVVAENALADIGVTPIATESIAQNAPDPGPQVASLVRAGAETILMIVSQEDAARIAKAVRQQDSEAQLLCINTCSNFPQYAELAGKAAEGTVSVRLGVTVHPTPEVQEWADRYAEKTGDDTFPPPEYAFESYDAARMLFETYGEVGTEPGAVIDALSQVTDFQGLSGTISYAAGTHNGLSAPENYALVVIKDGKATPLEG